MLLRPPSYLQSQNRIGRKLLRNWYKAVMNSVPPNYIEHRPAVYVHPGECELVARRLNTWARLYQYMIQQEKAKHYARLAAQQYDASKDLSPSKLPFSPLRVR